MRRGFKNHRRRVGPLADLRMMTEQEIAMTSLSMEAIPSGRAMPDWLVESLLKGRRLMIIHPSEECRKQAIEKLHKSR